ncbi:MAG: hypothetical protein CMJ52_08040 [Planctomycetaceae bacterium]|nr:hypothetical protein [Planctomycetaceae bacterium]
MLRAMEEACRTGVKDSPMNDDPFSILDLPVRFDVDPDVVRRKVMRATLALHPDRATDPVQASENTSKLAAMNAAARSLENDLERAEIVLRRHGGPSPAEDRSLPDGFLESMLEVRMELASAHASGDEADRARLEEWAKSEWDARRAAVARLLEGDGDHPPDRAALVAVRLELNRWRYAQRMLEQIDPDVNALDL